MNRAHMAILVERYVAAQGNQIKVIIQQLVKLDTMTSPSAPSLNVHIDGGDNLSRAQVYVELLDELRDNPPTHLQIARLFQNVTKAERAKFFYVKMLLCGMCGVVNTSKVKITQPQLELLREWLFCGCVVIDHNVFRKYGRMIYDKHSIIANAIRQESI